MTSSAAAQYTKEGAVLKDKAKILIEAFIKEVQSNKSLGKKVKGNEPKMALRAIRSILLSPDSIYGDVLEQALSEGWNGEKLKNKVRTMMEAGSHRKLSPAPHFTLHHTGGSLGSLGPSAQVAEPNVLRQTLIEVTERGAKLGESGLIGLPEYAHTGAINQRLKKLGLSNLDTPGISFLNAHLGDQRFTGYNVDAVAGFGSSDDLVAAWWDSGIIPQQMLDAQIGIEAARSELNELAKVAKEFGLDIDKNPGEVQKLLRKNPKLLERVVRSGNIGDIPSLDKRLALGNLPSTVNHLFKDAIRYGSNIPGVKPTLEMANVIRKNPVVSTVTALPVFAAFDVTDIWAAGSNLLKDEYSADEKMKNLEKQSDQFKFLSAGAGLSTLNPYLAPVTTPLGIMSYGVHKALDNRVNREKTKQTLMDARINKKVPVANDHLDKDDPRYGVAELKQWDQNIIDKTKSKYWNWVNEQDWLSPYHSNQLNFK
tara:strand:- start:255 stop:1700 length:1446 start_codon:yes stop_codon:yes gene_type:complete